MANLTNINQKIKADLTKYVRETYGKTLIGIVRVHFKGQKTSYINSFINRLYQFAGGHRYYADCEDFVRQEGLWKQMTPDVRKKWEARRNGGKNE